MNQLTDIARQIATEEKEALENRRAEDLLLIEELLQVWDQKALAEALNAVSPDSWSREHLNRALKGKEPLKALNTLEVTILKKMLPQKPDHYDNPDFEFIDLFAGIGGIRSGFEAIGGKCVFTSEWNKFSQKTYKANWYSCEEHIFNEDIREVTLSEDETISEEEAYRHISKTIPDHDVLLAGFPCQPFSLAGVSKKNALGRAHGFECEAQGTLFFDVARILKAKRPATFLLENVKNLKSHDKGKTFKIIADTLDELGYWVSDIEEMGSGDPKVIDAKHFIPQHRERIALVGFRKDLNIHEGFTLKNIKNEIPKHKPTFSELLDEEVPDKYTLTPRLWEYLYEYAKKHQAKGNGFGFGLVNPLNENSVARTLSARYHKDGSEILVDHKGWDMSLAESDFWNSENQANRPRRLTPRECARLMGFEKTESSDFRIPVSDTQSYRQFGNSVVVPVFAAIARLMKSRIIDGRKRVIQDKYCRVPVQAEL
ncbi:DNA (cytosine-5-)-methyltransferase [Amphritea balenae]|uniref:Cytosine-specific methyltransferase n=1 Tax=Amphritea balenae TaxID=452629 RepID=A0A3P1SMV6_9GAMM|nr:DNA (cytosine-5-)-methyltransferase [Amphritea balenae]RRC98488.1 DNA (cytosine-5-)-methyltransferase [Amphritea balenae]GGK64887.1 cytosine-specific methyltransferase [Amphritea balenae]